MKSLLLSLCMILVSIGLFGQNPSDVVARTQLDSRFAPFYHGVASGDPLSDQVIIWTRVTPTSSAPVSGTWKMATDTGMTNLVRSGTFTTYDSVDFTVKVDVDSLLPGTWYYYQFETDNRFSLVGRTFTAPVGNVDSLRFGVVSCSKYPDGYFNVYGRMAQRNDFHAILHLGDYLYELGDGSGDREHEPPNEIIDLDDYRERHSQYKLDADLRCLHQMYPMISVWDDHETSNNSWIGGALGHGANEGPWGDRKDAGIQSYLEWMPIRTVDPNQPDRIYRTIQYGGLLDFFMLDTRLIGRDEQVVGAGIDDPNRSLLGPDQLSWLSAEMQASTAQWKVLGQQVMMAPLEIPFVGPVNTDQWDGYRAERERVYDSILTQNIDNVVVLTGDIHTFWANDLPLEDYNPTTGDSSIGVEFVVAGVTSGNSVVTFGQQAITLANPHIKYVNLTDNGYIVLDFNQQRSQANYVLIDDISTPNSYGESEGGHYYVLDGEGHLQDTSASGNPPSSAMAVQPSKNPPNLVAVDPAMEALAFLGVYPNPTQEKLALNYYLHEPGPVEIKVTDLTGKVIHKENKADLPIGMHVSEISLKEAGAGIYILSISTPSGQVSRRIVKSN